MTTDNPEDTVPVIQKAQQTAEAPEIVDIPVPQIVLEQVAEVIQVIPQQPGSERTVEQIADVPATIERMTPGVPDAIECTWPSRSHRSESSSAPWSLNTNHNTRPSSRKSWSTRQMRRPRDQPPSPGAEADSDSAKRGRALTS